METLNVNASDVKILRDLARRTREIAETPINLERKQAWYALGNMNAQRPMILVETDAIAQEILSPALQCTEEWARNLEKRFRYAIYRFEQVGDDNVLEPYLACNWIVSQGDYGVEIQRTYADNETKMGAYHWEHPIKDLDRDFDMLKPRQFSVDREGTLKWKAHLEEIFNDILPVKIRGGYWWTLGMTGLAALLIGLENLMLYMYDNPQGLHQLMTFLRDDHLAFVDWLEKENLLTLNNENDYIGSGSLGYTRQLPQNDWKPDQPVRAKDLWVLLESQETVGVSPELFEEFVFQYQQPVIILLSVEIFRFTRLRYESFLSATSLVPANTAFVSERNSGRPA